MADPEDVQSEQVGLNWKRIRAGFFGGFLGWLAPVLVFLFVFFFYPDEMARWKVPMQAILLFSIFVFGTLGHWLATTRYNRTH